MSSSSSSSTEIKSSSSSSYIEEWSSSSDSSLSTEIRSSSSSSSSSSSYLDYRDDRIIPFIFETQIITPIWTLVSYGEDIFAGTGPDGMLLRSSDRYYWSKVFSVDDINIKSLYVQSNTLFIGTSPNGMIYIMDLSTGDVSLSQELGGDIFGFIYYKNRMYAAGGIPNQIWIYNTVKGRWDAFYKPHDAVVNKMLIFQDKLYAL
jgi:outer membrane protein assembly factor BamB